MRASFVLSEVVTGLRRNVTMTVAMIVTTAIALGMLGGGLIVVRKIDQIRANFYSQTEVSIYLTDASSANDTTCSKDPCAALRSSLENNTRVASVTYASRQEVYQDFQHIFSSQPELRKLTRPQALPATLHVKLKNPTKSQALVQQYQGKPGVQNINDANQFLERLFSALNVLRNIVFGIALFLALASLLLISNMIQLSAFTRRTEVGIMRLVGASRWYTQLPFLLEAVVASVAGALIGIGLLVGGKFASNGALSSLVSSGIFPPVTGTDIAVVAPILVVAAILVSGATSYVTLRWYVRL
jgi:cell division transport system permease protein